MTTQRTFAKTMACIAAMWLLPMALLAQLPWHWEGGTIVVDTPQQAEGQQSALALRTEPLSIIRVAFVGLDNRSPRASVRCPLKSLRLLTLPRTCPCALSPRCKTLCRPPSPMPLRMTSFSLAVPATLSLISFPLYNYSPSTSHYAT